MAGILEGVRVLEVAQWWFVPSAGAVLADWGADVIKIEHPEVGDPQRGLMTSGMVPGGGGGINYMMEQPNRGKRSVGIDIKSEGGREVLYRLAESSDVFLTSFLPDARRRLRIDVEDLRARNPNLVYARGSGQGTRGPDAEKPGFDGTSFWCRGAIATMLTPRDREQPVAPRPAFGDGISGMTLAGAVAGALFRRERTGVAPVVDVSLLGVAMWVLSPDINISAVTEAIPIPGRGAPANPLVNNYRARDGRWIQLCMLQADRDWPDFCRHIGRPDLVADPRYADLRRRAENAAALVEELDAIFAARPLAEWRKQLATLQGAWTPVQTPRELHEDPQALANGYLRDVEAPDGSSFQLVASPVQYDEAPPELRPAPEHGQHTEEVLLELGLSWDEIVQYKEGRAIL